MKLTIFYQNSGVKKDTSSMESVISALQSVLAKNLTKNPHFAGVKEVSMTMTLCGKTKIRTLNKQYRQKDYVTDVLSFPIYDNLRPDKKPRGRNLSQMDLGDLVICKEKALSQAREFEITYEQEVVHLAVHGFLHLIGFDHEISNKEEKIMEAHENELVGQVYKILKKKK
ncbi:rRNA maturation RNase YbeY [Bacteriovorax sp. PP10]|uniref:Endoribonuclease YbeY n=1 Tax=Bacteriovorax antarcticus TaxID=3088717 RepID=A0ABU5VQY2_9BACT|nr:rRNA maturation RNase YbeY [Bacteriovorax sp. PP10]MEA9355449.1 rRNA maturation RNase YbeY [Bacteriovorax sp. PP10]